MHFTHAIATLYHVLVPRLRTLAITTMRITQVDVAIDFPPWLNQFSALTSLTIHCVVSMQHQFDMAMCLPSSPLIPLRSLHIITAGQLLWEPSPAAATTTTATGTATPVAVVATAAAAAIPIHDVLASVEHMIVDGSEDIDERSTLCELATLPLPSLITLQFDARGFRCRLGVTQRVQWCSTLLRHLVPTDTQTRHVSLPCTDCVLA